jgi:two-component system sensor histidine kinase/response regulator
MDGLEATRQIRAREQSRDRWHPNETIFAPLQPTKIIALTASIFEEERQAILLAGCNDFVGKPCSKSLFLEKMSQHLGVKYLSTSRRKNTRGKHRQQVQVPSVMLRDILHEIMPPEWLAALNFAARSADDKAILQLLCEIPVNHAELKATIVQLVDNFQLEQLIELTAPQTPHLGDF